MRGWARLGMLVVLCALWASSAQAATYYVATTGSDAVSCATAETIGTPKLTISAGVACASAGDTVYLRAGTYTGALNQIHAAATTVRSGTNFGAGAITIAAYTAEEVILMPGVTTSGNAITLGTQEYIIFDRLILDGTGVLTFSEPGGLYGGSHIRFQDGEIRNWLWQGVSGVSNSEILRSRIHHNGHSGLPHTHGIYLTSSNNLIEGNELSYNAGNGLVVYDVGTEPSNNIARGNWFHDNCQYYESELTFSSGDGNTAYNNIFSGPQTCNAIDVEFDTPTNTKIYNNTIVHTAAINVGSDAAYTLITNNIIRSASNAGAGSITDGGTGTVETTNSTTDPAFTNGTGSLSQPSDFNISITSTMRDTGTALASVLVDYLNTVRPQNIIQDIGAYEYIVGSPSGTACSPSTTFALIAHTAKGSADALTVTTDPIDTTDACEIVAAVADDQAGAVTFTDLFANTWILRTPYPASGPEGTMRIQFYDCAPCLGGPGHTFTATRVSANAYPAIAVAAITGTITTPFDLEAGDTASATTTIQAGSLTPSQNMTAIFAAVAFDGNPGGAAISLNGFTLLDTTGSSGFTYGIGLGYLNQSTAAAVNPLWTVSSTTDLAAAVADYKLVTTSTAPTLYRMRRAAP